MYRIILEPNYEVTHNFIQNNNEPKSVRTAGSSMSGIRNYDRLTTEIRCEGPKGCQLGLEDSEPHP